MIKKRKPTGFVAECQCGLIVGALDYNRINRQEAGRIIGKWLDSGCKVIPQFDASWQVTCNECRCGGLSGDGSTA